MLRHGPFFVQLLIDCLEQTAFDRGDHARQFVAALEHLAMFAEQRPHTLFVAQGRAFLDPRLRTFGGAPKSSEHSEIPGKIHRIVTPLTGSDHAPVEIENTGELRKGT